MGTQATVSFLAPKSVTVDSHVRDAMLWEWATQQDMVTFEDIECRCGVVTMLLVTDASIDQLCTLLQSFKAKFGA